MTENSNLFAFYIITKGDETGESAHGPYTMADAEARVKSDEKIITRTTLATIKQIEPPDQNLSDVSTEPTQSTVKGNLYSEELISPGNPFLTIWTKPRATIRHILRTDPKKHVLLLAMISGIYQSLDRASDNASGDNMSLFAIILVSALFGSFGGIVSLFIGGFIFGWSGRLIGGEAESEEIRTALAWSSVPDLLLLLMYIPIIAIFGHDWFTSSTSWIDANEALFYLVFVIVAVIGVTIVIWKAFILICSVAEAHEFSFWRGLASIIIGFLAILVPLFILIFGCNALT